MNYDDVVIQINLLDILLLADNNYGDWVDTTSKDTTIENYNMNVQQAIEEVVESEKERLMQDKLFLSEMADRATEGIDFTG